LRVHGRDEFGCGGLLSLTLLPQVLPTFNVGGMCGLLCWWVWLDRWYSSSVGVCACIGSSVGGRAVGVGVFVCGSLLLPPPLFLWAGVGIARSTSRLCSGGQSPSGQEELLIHLGDPGAKRGDLFGEAVGVILKGGVVLGKEFSDPVKMVCVNCSRTLLVIISMSV